MAVSHLLLPNKMPLYYLQTDVHPVRRLARALFGRAQLYNKKWSQSLHGGIFSCEYLINWTNELITMSAVGMGAD